MKTSTALIALTCVVALIASCKTVEPADRDLAASVEPPVEGTAGIDNSIAGPRAQRALEAMDAMKKEVGGKLAAAVKEGGPASAISVCKTEGPAAAGVVGERHGLVMGRMSHKLRNPENAPPSWASEWMAENGGRPSAEVQPITVELDGGKLGVIKPIGTMSVCTKCHGDETSIPEEVKRELQKTYPEDQAVGFAEGQVRGAFWAEVPAE